METNTQMILQDIPIESLKEVASQKRFVEKLYQMLEDKSNANVIWWSADGSSFSFKHQEEELKPLVSKYFTHENCSTFYRQLNFYSFKRIERLEGSLVFQHPKFLKGRKDLLKSIKRLKAKEKSLPCSEVEQSSTDKASEEPCTKRYRKLMDAIQKSYGEIRKLRFENDRLRRVSFQIQQDLHREPQVFLPERNRRSSFANQFDQRSETRSFENRFAQPAQFQRQYDYTGEFSSLNTSQTQSRSMSLNNELQTYQTPIYNQNFTQIRDQNPIQYDISARPRPAYPFQTIHTEERIPTSFFQTNKEIEEEKFDEFWNLDLDF